VQAGRVRAQDLGRPGLRLVDRPRFEQGVRGRTGRPAVELAGTTECIRTVGDAAARLILIRPARSMASRVSQAGFGSTVVENEGLNLPR
jgi:hypothetical protein